MMNFRAKIENACIRGCQRGTNKQGGEYLLVNFEDETGTQSQLVDNDVDREKYYKRNNEGDLYVQIKEVSGKNGFFTSARIVDFKMNTDEKENN